MDFFLNHLPKHMLSEPIVYWKFVADIMDIYFLTNCKDFKTQGNRYM